MYANDYYYYLLFGCRISSYDLKEFAFSHDKSTSSLKEYFQALEMDKMHAYVVFI